jgi:hypothetical protein
MESLLFYSSYKVKVSCLMTMEKDLQKSYLYVFSKSNFLNSHNYQN